MFMNFIVERLRKNDKYDTQCSLANYFFNEVGTLLDLWRTWEGNFLIVDMGNNNLIHKV